MEGFVGFGILGSWLVAGDLLVSVGFVIFGCFVCLGVGTFGGVVLLFLSFIDFGVGFVLDLVGFVLGVGLGILVFGIVAVVFGFLVIGIVTFGRRVCLTFLNLSEREGSDLCTGSLKIEKVVPPEIAGRKFPSSSDFPCRSFCKFTKLLNPPESPPESTKCTKATRTTSVLNILLPNVWTVRFARLYKEIN